MKKLIASVALGSSALTLLAVWLLMTVVVYAPRIVVSPYPHQTYFSVRDVEATRAYLRGHVPAGSEVTSVWCMRSKVWTKVDIAGGGRSTDSAVGATR